MRYLADSRFDKCLTLLRKAEELTTVSAYRYSESLRILTFNNLGCCYRRLGKLKVALKYLKSAADAGHCSCRVSNLSLTHLNICAIQSELGRHDIALEHAQSAVFHCQEELVSAEMEEDQDLEDVLEPKTKQEKMVTMAIAYHNLAVEMEFTGKGDMSLQVRKMVKHGDTVSGTRKRCRSLPSSVRTMKDSISRSRWRTRLPDKYVPRIYR